MTTARTAFVAIAASTADPPRSRIASPADGREVVRRDDRSPRPASERDRDEGSIHVGEL